MVKIGIINQQFEKYWITKEGIARRRGANRFCLILNIMNLPNLIVASAITDDMPDRVDSFCREILRLLEGMPQDEQGLHEAFRDERLCGLPMQKFVFAAPNKFLELRNFVLRH